MHKPLPDLSALRSFETVARHFDSRRRSGEPGSNGCGAPGGRHVGSERGAKFSLAELAMQVAIDGSGIVPFCGGLAAGVRLRLRSQDFC